MRFEGEVGYFSQVMNYDPEKFYADVQEQLAKCEDFQPEVHYQMTMQPNGRALQSALIIGRVRRDGK